MKGKRETRFELATSNLEGWHSTTELLPQTPLIYHDNTPGVKGWQAFCQRQHVMIRPCHAAITHAHKYLYRAINGSDWKKVRPTPPTY